MTISFVNCGITNLERLSGGMSVYVNSISNGYYVSGDVSINVSNLSIVSGSTTASSTGDMRLRIKEDAAKTIYSITLNQLTSSSTVFGVTKSFGMSNFSMSLTDSLTGTDQITYEGTLSMSSFGNQSVVLTTLSPWLQKNGDIYPYAGQMLLTGESGSKIRITAVTATTVRLELDAAGDGVYKASKVVTWASLR